MQTWDAAAPQLYDSSSYSQETLRSLANVDEAILNYDLMEGLICAIVGKVRPSPSAVPVKLFWLTRTSTECC